MWTVHVSMFNFPTFKDSVQCSNVCERCATRQRGSFAPEYCYTATSSASAAHVRPGHWTLDTGHWTRAGTCSPSYPDVHREQLAIHQAKYGLRRASTSDTFCRTAYSTRQRSAESRQATWQQSWIARASRVSYRRRFRCNGSLNRHDLPAPPATYPSMRLAQEWKTASRRHKAQALSLRHPTPSSSYICTYSGHRDASAHCSSAAGPGGTNLSPSSRARRSPHPRHRHVNRCADTTCAHLSTRPGPSGTQEQENNCPHRAARAGGDRVREKEERGKLFLPIDR
ncbi:hypothetical protein L227DRAFT_250844 [Lentinus tigrinus ALCF2SS1-6]|uniref:Uncharacterized protein n=1 Tax=Lentinus tigrinus ALCF2SS1-6 TaxID=1328759 RepID=A0A5C2S1J8_9APHY|nr:hypothetical protein L227DRAFT_250844 [Lentinus tigrinus ALCF2SS1-6]